MLLTFLLATFLLPLTHTHILSAATPCSTSPPQSPADATTAAAFATQHALSPTAHTLTASHMCSAPLPRHPPYSTSHHPTYPISP